MELHLTPPGTVLNESINLDKNIAKQLRNLGLELITSDNKNEALISLFGINYQDYLSHRNLI